MESLALKYRPRSFDDLVGQKAVQVILRKMVATNLVPTALLFDGSRGTGKTTTARIFAAALNCETPPGPCGHCPSCKSVFDGTSLDLMEIDAASNGLVDDIRQLRQQVLYSVGGRYRVVALDEAHSMGTSAFNALLKTLEEPPPETVFILLTTEPGRIPDTVASRCMPFTFRRISVADIAARLAHICAEESITVETGLLTVIAERADGGMRDAVMSLDQVTRVGVTTVEAFTELMGETDYGPTLLSAVAEGDVAAAFACLHEQMIRTGDAARIAVDLVDVLRDILILNAGGTLTRQGGALEARQQLAGRIDSAHAVAACKILWDLKTKVRAGDDPRAGLDLAVVMLTEIFAKTAKPTPTAAPARRLSLAEMAAMA